MGPSIAGVIIDSNTASDGKINFLPVQLYGGSWFIGGCFATLLVPLLRRFSRKPSVGAVREGESLPGIQDEEEKP